MDSTLIGLIIGGISLLVGVWSLFVSIQNSKNKGKHKLKVLSANERLDCLNRILSYNHNFVLNLYGSAFIFKPDGEIIFGASWVSYEWLELLGNFIEKDKLNKTTVATFGSTYYLADLFTGKNIRIPLDPQKGMTMDVNGIKLGHIYMFIPFDN